MAKGTAIFLSSICIVLYAFVFMFIDPLADLATSLVLKTGIPLRDLESKRHDFIINIAYISFIIILFILLDILTRYRRSVSLLYFLFTGYRGRRREPEYPFRLIVFVSTFVVAPVLAIAFLQPSNLVLSKDRPNDVSFFQGFFLEDGPMEWATAITFAIAGILLLKAGSIMRGAGAPSRRWLRWLVYGVAASAFIVALEEISWGQRLLGWDTPDVIEAHNVQDETNLHNMIGPYLDLITESTLNVRFYFVIGATLFLVSWSSCLLDILGKLPAFSLLPHATLVFLAAEISVFSQQNLTNELVEELAAIFIILLAWQFLRQAKGRGVISQ